MRKRTPAEVKAYQEHCDRQIAGARWHLEEAQRAYDRAQAYYTEESKHAAWRQADDFCDECGRAGSYRTCCYEGHP